MRGNERAGKQTNLAVIARAAQNELQELVRKRAEMNQRIVVLRRSIRALLSKDAVRNTQLNRAIKLSPRKRAGLTHICRIVLKRTARPLTAHDLTEEIRVSHAPEAARHRDLLASVSAVLRYLLESGEANNTFDDDGNRTWFATHHELEEESDETEAWEGESSGARFHVGLNDADAEVLQPRFPSS
jgi:hypothetical protein